MPNVKAMAERLASGMLNATQQQAQQQQLMNYARSCVQPGITYFQDQLASSLRESLAAFKAVRNFSPQKANTM